MQRILEFDKERVGATKYIVKDMAYDLFAKGGGELVGEHCVDNLKTRSSEVKLQKSGPYDYQSALNKDPGIIKP